MQINGLETKVRWILFQNATETKEMKYRWILFQNATETEEYELEKIRFAINNGLETKVRNDVNR